MDVEIGEGVQDECLWWGPLHQTARITDSLQLVPTTSNSLGALKGAGAMSCEDKTVDLRMLWWGVGKVAEFLIDSKPSLAQ